MKLIMNLNKKALSFILSVFMVIGMVPCGEIHLHAEDPTTVDVNLQLKAVDSEGNEIDCLLDVNHTESGYWVGTEACDYDSTISLNIGENTLAKWDVFPAGYYRPKEDITLTCDEEGHITVTSGNATVEVTDTMTYIVVTLQADYRDTVDVNLQLKAVNSDGDEIDGALDAFHPESQSWVGTEDCGYESLLPLKVGENTIENWISYPDGYFPLTEDITFICDEDGNITVTSGNATVEVTDTMTYIVVTLQKDYRAKVDLQLKAVNSDGDEIDGRLDVLHSESETWIGTDDCGYDSPVHLVMGENTLTRWDLCPDGYISPTEDITFTFDEEGNINVTSGNATVEVTDTMTYIVVTLQQICTVDVDLQLKAVNSDGDEIDGRLDAYLRESCKWVGTAGCVYETTVPLVVGENTLEKWDYCPEGYLRPTEDITFICDEDGNITVTSGNATVEVTDTMTYIVVTLQEDNREFEEVILQLKAVDSEGNEIEGSLDAYHRESSSWVGTADMEYDSIVSLVVGENTLENWGCCPEGYLCPTDAVEFTCDKDGNITVTSGNATVEVTDTMTYIVVTLQADDGGDSDDSCSHENMSGWIYQDSETHYKYCLDCATEDSYESAEHNGGTATCNSLAVCNDCGQGYGELSNNHERMSGWFHYDDTQHYKYCLDCGSESSFVFEEHSGGTATCANRAICEVCNSTYGDLSDKHEKMSEWLQYDDAQHYKYCLDCTSESSYIFGDHKGGTATCLESAICEECNNTYGDLSDKHEKMSEWIKYDETRHYKYCLDCASESSYIFEDHKGGTATCLDPATCEVCKSYYGEISHKHARMSEWLQYDETRHYKYCLDCVSESSQIFEEHKGGTATCLSSAICEVCDIAYGEISDKHVSMSEWFQYDETRHYKYCLDCGRESSYIFEEHKGGTATCLSSAICEVCDIAYGEISDKHEKMSEWVPYDGTQHCKYCLDCGIESSFEYEDHKGGTATCLSLAVCTGCGSEYGSYSEVHEDVSAWKYNDEEHWKECLCGEVIEKGEHTDNNGDDLCDVCGSGSFMLGDVNGDGKINLDDVVALLRHVSKAVVITDPKALAAAEIVEDGILNIDDVVRLLRFVSKAVPSLR